MDIDFAFICDYADVTGKINALGIGFDTIYAREVPIRPRTFYLVAQLRMSVAEAGSKDVEFHLIDADGADVIPPLRKKVEIPTPSGAFETKGRLAMAFNNIEFPRYGVYSLHLVIQGSEMVRIPLRVTQPPTTPQIQSNG